MALKLEGEEIIDFVTGFSKENSEEVIRTRAEVMDSNGIPFKDADVSKVNRYCQLMEIRNELWLAKLN